MEIVFLFSSMISYWKYFGVKICPLQKRFPHLQILRIQLGKNTFLKVSFVPNNYKQKTKDNFLLNLKYWVKLNLPFNDLLKTTNSRNCIILKLKVMITIVKTFDELIQLNVNLLLLGISRLPAESKGVVKHLPLQLWLYSQKSQP